MNQVTCTFIPFSLNTITVNNLVSRRNVCTGRSRVRNNTVSGQFFVSPRISNFAYSVWGLQVDLVHFRQQISHGGQHLFLVIIISYTSTLWSVWEFFLRCWNLTTLPDDVDLFLVPVEPLKLFVILLLGFCVPVLWQVTVSPTSEMALGSMYVSGFDHRRFAHLGNSSVNKRPGAQPGPESSFNINL